MVKRAELQKVLPVLPARDVNEAIRFYVDRLGFELAFRDPTSPDDYAGIRRGHVVLHLQFQFEKDFQKGTAGQAMLRFVVDDAAALFDEYKDKGVFHDRTALRDTTFGTREFSFWDINRNGLTFLQIL
jgi:catechol 2,3-dioxygenase-like lactoylglutathione lyase family enzyme